MLDKTFPIAEMVIARSVVLTLQLEQLLQEESACLKQGSSSERLNSIVEKKLPVITDINQFSRQLSQILATESLSNDQQGVHTYFERAAAAGNSIATIQANWEETIRLAKQCRLLNEQNGAMIDMLQRHTQRSLNILKGKPMVANTYGKDGTAKSDPYSRELISV